MLIGLLLLVVLPYRSDSAVFECKNFLSAATTGIQMEPISPVGKAPASPPPIVRPAKDFLTNFNGRRPAYPDYTDKVIEFGRNRTLAKIVSQANSKARMQVIDFRSIDLKKAIREVSINLADLGHVKESSDTDRFERTLRILNLLLDHPEIRVGKSLLWTPNVEAQTQFIPRSEYRRYTQFAPETAIRLNLSGNVVVLPGTPEIREPLVYGIYGMNPHLRVKVERIDLEKMEIEFICQRFYKNESRLVMPLSEEWLRNTNFVESPISQFFFDAGYRSRGHDEFRMRFGLGRLEPGDYFIEQRETGDPAANIYRVVEIEGYRITAVTPRGDYVVFGDPNDMARLALSTGRIRKTLQQVFTEEEAQFYGTTEIEAQNSLELEKLITPLRQFNLTWVRIVQSVRTGFIDNSLIGDRRVTVTLAAITNSPAFASLSDGQKRVLMDFFKIYNFANSSARKR